MDSGSTTLDRYLSPQGKLSLQAHLAAKRTGGTKAWGPHPWQIAPLADRAPILLLTGSKGGGKSTLAANKVHRFLTENAGAMGLVIRKTRESMINSTVLFLERNVIRGDAALKVSANRFEYPHGSLLAYGGMKDREQREQVRSIGAAGGIDILWIEEANALEEHDFNEVFPTLRAKAGPYRQAILTTNPDSPLHWIYRRMIAGGEAKVYYSHARDNPSNPADYQAKLDSLTGTESERLAKGLWVQAEGLVYSGVWLDSGENANVAEGADYEPGAGPVFWFCDDGYSSGSKPQTLGIDVSTGHYVADAHPRVFLLVQQRADGRLHVFAEHYACGKLTDAHIAEVQALSYPAPDWAAHGPGAAEFRGRLFAAGIVARQCMAQVEPSIKELRSCLAADDNGWRRVRVHPRCRHLRAELGAYAYEAGTEKPVKQFDHGPDALRGGNWLLRFER